MSQTATHGKTTEFTPDHDRRVRRMSDVQRTVATWLVITALTALLGLGTGWVGAMARDTAQDQRIASLERELAEQRTMLERIDARVAAMYCAQVPVQIREGCR